MRRNIVENLQEGIRKIRVDVTKLGLGVVGDGVTDVTKSLNDAIKWVKDNGYETAYIPAGTYLINGVGTTSNAPFREGGIVLPDDINIIMDYNTVLKIIPNDAWGYSCFYVAKVKNVTIRGGQIIGDKSEHVHTPVEKRETHEWGFGVCIEGGENVVVEGIRIKECTGDGVIVSPKGILGTPNYVPSRNVFVRKCVIDGSRRNNISVTGGEYITLEDNVLTNAGVDGVTPKFGIDIESYGEGDIDYEEPLYITVRGNHITGSVRASICNFNGYGVVITENIVDSYISYGHGTETIISNNVVKKLETFASIIDCGINALGISGGTSGNNSIVSNNVVTGFSTGIDLRGGDVLVTGNKVSQFEVAGIASNNAKNVLIDGNQISAMKETSKDGQGVRVFLGDDVTVTSNRVKGCKTGVYFYADKGVIKGNHITNVGKGIYTNKGEVLIEDNTLTDGVSTTNIPAGEVISVIGSGVKSVIRNNYISRFSRTPIYAYSTSSEIINNTLKDVTSLTAIQAVGLSHVVEGNSISMRLPSTRCYGIYLDKASNSFVLKNTIRSTSGNRMESAITTNTSSSTKIYHNLIFDGTIRGSDTDEIG